MKSSLVYDVNKLTPADVVMYCFVCVFAGGCCWFITKSLFLSCFLPVFWFSIEVFYVYRDIRIGNKNDIA